jgi:hypothetical protein
VTLRLLKGAADQHMPTTRVFNLNTAAFRRSTIFAAAGSHFRPGLGWLVVRALETNKNPTANPLYLRRRQTGSRFTFVDDCVACFSRRPEHQESAR